MASPGSSVLRVLKCNKHILRPGYITQRCTSTSVNSKTHTQVGETEEFRVLVIPGHTDVEEKKRTPRRAINQNVQPPRYKSMPLGQDWTNVWPSAHTFKYSAVPLPIRQGYAHRQENDGISPAKYGNAELMKIPNFLHLSPVHVKKHCAALKEFCNDWPSGLDTEEACERHFPATVLTQDYVFDGPSLRDPRAREVTIKFKLSSLPLDYHARDKMVRLVGERYEPKTDMVTLQADRCPMKKQNLDYTMFLLTALYFESWNVEEWETEKEAADMEKYTWEKMPSKTTLLKTLNKMKETTEKTEVNTPEYLSEVHVETEDTTVALKEVESYRKTLAHLHDSGEDFDSLNKYKESVVKLLIGANTPNLNKT